MSDPLPHLADPSLAPRRDDVPFLVRRARSGRHEQPSQLAGRTSPHPAHPPVPLPVPPTPPVRPAPVPPAPPVPPARPVPAAPVVGTTTSAGLLDLSTDTSVVEPSAAFGSAPATAGSVSAATPPAAGARLREPSFVARSIRSAPFGGRTLLTPDQPSVVLNRLQSGIGALAIDAAASAAVGDLRIGCAYDLEGGHSSIVVPSDGLTTAPRGSKTPVIIGREDGVERLQIDLRQNRRFQRLIVYGFSATDATLRWGGTLILTGLGDTRIELPMNLPESGGVAALLSIYNVGGEFVIRGEMEIINGSVRDACTAYGFDRISWLDGRHPVS